MNIGTLTIEMAANVARLQRDMDQARSIVGSTAATIERAAQAARNALGAIGLGVGLSQLVSLTDQYTKFTAQLRLATNSQQEYARVYSEVRRISTAAQSDLGATGTLYARIANGTRELGLSQARLSNVTETVSLALRVSGATATEAASAQLQLSQAFAAGALRGEEFNAVNEAAPRLMQALADGMGVPVGALKQMASEGKITSQVMAEVLPKALNDLREEAKNVQTIAGSFQLLKNAVMEFVGASAQSSGVVAGLAGGISLLADNLNLVAGAVLTIAAAKLGSWLADAAMRANTTIVANRALAASTLATAQADAAATGQAVLLANARLNELRAATLAATGEVQLAVATNGLIPAQARAAAAAEAHSLALGRLSVAQRAASFTAGAASTALAALGGPIGAIITVLGVAATAWSWYSSKSEEANAKAAEDTEESTYQIIANLEKGNQKLRERIALAKQAGMGAVAVEGGPAAERLAQTLKDINALKDKGNKMTLVEQVELVTLQGLYNELQASIQSGKSLKGELDASGSAATDLIAIRQRLSGVNQKYLDDLTKLERARSLGAIGEKEYVDLVSQLAAETYKASEAGKSATTSVSAQAKAYATLLSNVSEKIALTNQEVNQRDKLTESQRLQIDLNERLASGELKLSPQQKAKYEGMIRELKAGEELQASQERASQGAAGYAKIMREQQDTVAKRITDAEQEANRNEELARTYGMTAAAIAAADVARLEEQLAQRASTGMTLDEVEALKQLIEHKRRNATALVTLDGMGKNDAVQQAKDMMDIMSRADEMARSAAQGMASAFGKVGTAIGGVSTAMSGLSKSQATIAAQLAAALKADPTKAAKLSAEAARESAQAQIRSYGDMASAAKGFFAENSTGYKVMEGVEKAYRATEMAMALETMVMKSGLLTAFTNLFVASKATETLATQASVAPDVAASMTKGAAAAAVGVANQAQGDPYSAWARMAAMAAVMAGLGFAVAGGGGNKNVAAERQAAMGTGSVLGDAKGKSDSIANSLDLIEKNSDIQLSYTGEMVRALLAIENSIGGLANTVVRSMGFDGSDKVSGTSANNSAGIRATGALMGAVGGAGIGYSISLIGSVMGPVGMVIGAIIGAIISKFSKVKTELRDEGFDLDAGTLGGMSQGVTGRSYQDINVKKTFAGMTYSNNTDRFEAPMATDVQNQFTQVIANLRSGIIAAVTTMGEGGTTFIERLDALAINIPDISLKGLTGEQIQEKLSHVFGKVADDLAIGATAPIPFINWLPDFQKVGEGAFETLNRLASNYANLNSLMEAMGRTFGATGYASLEARERLIAFAGGIENLAKQTATFTSEYLTEAQRLAPVQKYVTDQMAALGLTSVKTRDQFRDVALGLDVTTDAGARQFAAMMALAGMFDQLQDQIEEMAETGRDLVQAYDDAKANYREAVSAVSDIVRGLAEDVVSAAAEVKSAQDAISDAYFNAVDAKAAAEQRLIDLQRQAAQETTAFSGTIQRFLASLNTSSVGSATSAAQLSAMKAQFSSTAVLAQAGDKDARSALVGLAQNLLGAQKDASTDRVQFAMAEAQIKAALNGVVAALDAQAAAAPAPVDPMMEAQRELLAAEKRMLELAQLASSTGSSIDASSRVTAGSTTALLTAYNAAVAKQDLAQADYQTALRLTSGLALTSTNNLTALGLALANVSNAQVEVIKARNDLVQYADDIGDTAETLDQTIENMRTRFGNASLNADTLASSLGLLGTEVQTLLAILAGQSHTPPASPATAQFVSQIFSEVLGRAPDAAGKQFWVEKIDSGVLKLAEAAKLIALSAANSDMTPEGKGAGWTIGQAMADQAAAAQWLHTMGVPGFAVGTNNVPHDMLAMIHEDERIIPAADNRELMMRLREGSGGAAMAAELAGLREEMSKLRAATDKIVNNTGATANHAGRTKDALEAVIYGDEAIRNTEVPA